MLSQARDLLEQPLDFNEPDVLPAAQLLVILRMHKMWLLTILAEIFTLKCESMLWLSAVRVDCWQFSENAGSALRAVAAAAPRPAAAFPSAAAATDADDDDWD